MFLAPLETELLEKIARMFELVKVARNEFVIKQGTKGTHLYIVQSGSLKAWSPDEPDKVYVTYGPGQIFGELTYLYPSRKASGHEPCVSLRTAARTAPLVPALQTFLHITADASSELWRIEHEMLRKVISSWQILRMAKYEELLDKARLPRPPRPLRGHPVAGNQERAPVAGTGRHLWGHGAGPAAYPGRADEHRGPPGGGIPGQGRTAAATAHGGRVGDLGR